MKKNILLLRHGQSEDNCKGVIQGVTQNSDITQSARLEINKIANCMEIYDIKSIYSSPMQRAISTASIIAERLNLPIIVKDDLIEFNSGILSGISHIEAEKKYPMEYEIWKKRKDLDGIQGAETGDVLQSRALYVIDSIIENNNNILIVSHCGFLRCLINTLIGNERTKPIVVDHYYLHKINKINLKKKIIKQSENKIIKLYKTKNGKYIFKQQNNTLKNGNFNKQFENKLMPKILLERKNDNKFVAVYKFVKGKHIKGKVNISRIDKFIQSWCELTKFLSEIKDADNQRSISHKINKVLKDVHYKYHKILKNINYEFGDRIFIHYDMHRENILFDRKNIFFLDFEAILLADYEFAIGCMLVGFFLVEGYDINFVDEIINKYFFSFDKDKIYKAMLIKSILSSYYFKNAKTIHDRKLKASYEKIITELGECYENMFNNFSF